MRKSAEVLGEQVKSKTYTGLIDLKALAELDVSDSVLALAHLVNKQHATIASLEARIRDNERTIRHNKKG